MRFRLLRRRLTISSPRMRISAPVLPRYVQWLLMVLFVGLSAAATLWAFNFGKKLAELPSKALTEEAKALRTEVASLRAEKILTDKILATSDTLLATERATLEQLSERIRSLELENQSLQEDLQFFEKLIPSANKLGLNIRSLQAEMLDPTQLRWHVLLIQVSKKTDRIRGTLSLTFSGTRDGASWSATQNGLAFDLDQYKRISGVYALPEKTVVQSLTVKVIQKGKTKAVQTLKL